MPPRAVRVDCSAQSFLWLNSLAMEGWHRYSGERDLPPIFLTPPQRRRE
jgi:hypothetical protein